MKNIIPELPKFFTPGPTEVHPEVTRIISETKIYHRSPEFRSLYNSLLKKLKKIIHTENYVLVLTSSGTGAMESVVQNFCNREDKILYINQGRFGQRWGNICKAFGIPADEIFIKEGYSIQEADFVKLNLNEYAAIFLTHTETSTATLTEIESISKYIKSKSDSLIIVDAVSSIGIIPFYLDDWGIDVAVSASQKGFMCPPGVSIVTFNENAYKRINKNNLKFYFDFQRELPAALEGNTTWTPAVNLFAGLNLSCEIILNQGLESRWKNIHKIADDFRKRSIELGFELFSKFPSDSLTALFIPEKKNTTDFIQTIKEKYGALIANGQGDLKDKIIRVSHMGYLDDSDFQNLLTILEHEVKHL